MKRLIAAANENEIPVANAEGEAVFTVQQDGRLFVPYGNYPHPKGLQHFNREAADVMVRVFNSIGSRIARFFTAPGAPVYCGHPDVPGRPDSNPAAPAVGWVENISAENEGAYFGVKWNEDGERAVRSGSFRFYSPHWNCRPVKGGGIQPFQLLSIGLTNNPRIPVPAIANDQTNNTKPMLKKLMKLLGFAEDATPDDAAIEVACDAITTQLETATATANDLTTQVATLTTENTRLLGELESANTSNAEIRTELTAANDALTAARTARIDAEIANFVLTGRRTEAQRTATRDELLAIANDSELAARLGAIAAEKPQLHTATVTGGLGAAKSKVVSTANDEAARSDQRKQVIAAELAALANDASAKGLNDSDRYDRAFNRAKSKHPNLFPVKTAQA